MQTHPDDLLAQLSTGLGAAVATAAPSLLHVARRRGGGSAIAWTDELAVTSSFHAPDATRVGIPAPDGTLDERDAHVIGRDPGTDVAVLRVTGGGLAPAALRELAGLAVGQLAIALGRPGRAPRASLRILGVLGPERRTPRGGRLDRYIETDRAIPRGFAGGPLVDTAGQVIGMSTRTLLAGADLAVPLPTLHRVVAEIVAHGGVRRGYLGIATYPAALPSTLVEATGRSSGALVVGVEDGGPAAVAGVLLGDVVTALDGAPIADPDDLRTALWQRGGGPADLEVIRAGERRTLTVAIGTRP